MTTAREDEDRLRRIMAQPTVFESTRGSSGVSFRVVAVPSEVQSSATFAIVQVRDGKPEKIARWARTREHAISSTGVLADNDAAWSRTVLRKRAS